ncbi:MAG: hypothetical protein MZV64_48375 [Ignavibacteriales bacterium]|nr:hypothetical protein [Ignavibacteriales bacterium]
MGWITQNAQGMRSLALGPGGVPEDAAETAVLIFPPKSGERLPFLRFSRTVPPCLQKPHAFLRSGR